MLDLSCDRCSKILIEDFWWLVEIETERTFLSLSMTCSCGHLVHVDLRPRPRWVRSAAAAPLLARA
jgi:RNase P subunit RPR2